MAKYCTTTIAFALLGLLTITVAGNTPSKDEATTQVSLPLSEDANPALRLPSEPVNTETNPNSAVTSSVPLTNIPFRPVNRRFHVRSKHPCRHHFRFYPTMRENVEIPYGNDMLVSTGENGDFQEPVLHGEGRQFPERWETMHHHHHFNDKDGDRLMKIVFKRYDYNMFDRQKIKKFREHFRNEEEEKKKKKGSFMKRVRKFLDLHF